MVNQNASKDAVMHRILESACPCHEPDADGWMDYFIETHCVGWWITARKRNGAWEVKTFKPEQA